MCQLSVALVVQAAHVQETLVLLKQLQIQLLACDPLLQVCLEFLFLFLTVGSYHKNKKKCLTGELFSFKIFSTSAYSEDYDSVG